MWAGPRYVHYPMFRESGLMWPHDSYLSGAFIARTAEGLVRACRPAAAARSRSPSPSRRRLPHALLLLQYRYSRAVDISSPDHTSQSRRSRLDTSTGSRVACYIPRQAITIRPPSYPLTFFLRSGRRSQLGSRTGPLASWRHGTLPPLCFSCWEFDF
jgi:hypothetical protein